jgi:hypothetical protein
VTLARYYWAGESWRGVDLLLVAFKVPSVTEILDFAASYRAFVWSGMLVHMFPKIRY